VKHTHYVTPHFAVFSSLCHTPFSETLKLYSSANVIHQVLHPHKGQAKSPHMPLSLIIIWLSDRFFHRLTHFARHFWLFSLPLPSYWQFSELWHFLHWNWQTFVVVLCTSHFCFHSDVQLSAEVNAVHCAALVFSQRHHNVAYEAGMWGLPIPFPVRPITHHKRVLSPSLNHLPSGVLVLSLLHRMKHFKPTVTLYVVKCGKSVVFLKLWQNFLNILAMLIKPMPLWGVN
jgi:hypothetical protein